MTQKRIPTPMQWAALTFRRFVNAHYPIKNGDYYAALEKCALVDRACNSYAAMVLALELQEALHMPSFSEKRKKIMEVAGYVPNDHYDAEYTFADFVADKRAEAIALAKVEQVS